MTSHSSRATSILISDPAQLCSAWLPVPGPPPLSPFPPFSPPLSLCSVLSVIPQNTRAPIILRCNPIHPLSSSRPRNARKRSQQPSCPSSSSRCPRSRPRPPLSRPRRNPEPAPSNRYAKTLVFRSILLQFSTRLRSSISEQGRVGNCLGCGGVASCRCLAWNGPAGRSPASPAPSPAPTALPSSPARLPAPP